VLEGHAAGFIDKVPSSFSTLFNCFTHSSLSILGSMLFDLLSVMRRCKSSARLFLLIALSSLSSSQDVLQRQDFQQDPIVVSASQDWDGNDGRWSSFVVQIGHPPQTMKVLVSTYFQWSETDS
jgi:hypothetical protein